MLPLQGKKALITGIANKHSLATHIAQSLFDHGAEIGISYQQQKLLKWVQPVAEKLDARFVCPCDVASDQSIKQLFDEVNNYWESIDILIHGIAYADIDELNGRFLNVSRDGYQEAIEISAYSLVALARGAYPLMKTSKGCILTLTYNGSQKVMPGYNMMGVAKAALESTVKYLANDLGADKIRVNAISPGPVRTLSSSAFPNFRDTLDRVEQDTPLQENINASEVGKLAAFICSDAARHMTGSIIHLDSGAHIMGA